MSARFPVGLVVPPQKAEEAFRRFWIGVENNYRARLVLKTQPWFGEGKFPRFENEVQCFPWMRSRWCEEKIRELNKTNLRHMGS